MRRFRVSIDDFKRYLKEYADRYHQTLEDASSYESGGDGDTIESKIYHDNSQDENNENQLIDQTVSTAKDTKTSTGDDFSESILPRQAIIRMSEDEILALREELQNTYNSLQEYKDHGVYSAKSSHKLLHYRDLRKQYYEQTKETIVMDPQRIAEDFLAEYYYTLDHDLRSTRSISRFYETQSSINFGGIPDIVSRRKISRALVVSKPFFRVLE